VSTNSHDGTATRIPSGEAAAYGPVGRSPWLDVDWREHQRWVLVGGQPVNTIDWGEGPAIVFVHGLSGCWTNWLEQLPVFAGERRVVAIDLPGFGYSPLGSEPISMSGYARLLDGLLAELGVDAATVVGNSMGGFIGAELAIAFPQRVERLVLISAAGISTHRDPHVVRAVPTLRRLERVLLGGGGWLAAKSDAVASHPRLREAALGVVVRHPRRLPPPLTAEQVRGSGKPGFMQALEAVLDYELRDRLAEIACPTLVVWGDGDRLIHVGDADVFAELIPDSRKVIFEDTGHMAMLERPAAFNALVRDFLAE